MCLKTVNISAGKNNGTETKSFQIIKATREKTKKCPCSFRCLETGYCPGCEIEEVFGETHAFVKMTQDNRTCPYVIPFAFSYVCHCPTRLEIYRKYNK